MQSDLIRWLVDSDEPWTRYRTLVDLLDRTEDDPEVQAARAEMLAHPLVQALIAETAAWPGDTLKRHNDASHITYKLVTLADFGVRAGDPGVEPAISAVMAHSSPEGAFQSLVNIPQVFGGTGEDSWRWMLCDAPVLLYILLAMGLGDDPRVQRAAHHLAGLVDDNGWHCIAAPELGKFRGPGRKSDPCPIANVFALKALARFPELLDSPATRAGAAMLLWHWEHRTETKPYLFGMGSDFRKLKYPFVWYDILHVADVLSQLPFVHADPRFGEMLAAIQSQADASARYQPSSMYKAWKGWGFADKKSPSPWVTFLAVRILKRGCGER